MAGNECGTMVILSRRKNLTKSADENGQTPLHYAAHFGYLRIVKQLLECDKSAAHVRDNEDMTALLMAARQGHGGIMREIIKHCPGCCEIVDKRGWNFCHFAAISLHPFTVKRFLSDEVCRRFMDKEDIKGNTLLQVIATCRRPAVFRYPKEDLNSKKKEQIFKLVEEVEGGEVAGVAVRPMIVYKMGDKSFLDNRRALVSALIVIVTFSAAFIVPVAYKSNQSPKGQGRAILSYDNAFKAFIIADTIAMVSSLLAIGFNHLSSAQYIRGGRGRLVSFASYKFMQQLAFLSEAAFVVAFLTGLYVVSKPSLALAIGILIIVLSFFFINTFI